jgi:hypothetical protein
MPAKSRVSKLRSFAFGRNERSVPPDDPSKLPQDFVKRMERGDFDGAFSSEIKKLSKEQLEVLAQILLERCRKPLH